MSQSTTPSEPTLWNRWSPPGPEDVRSPCPCINTLANHSILPRSGRNITKEMLIDVLTHPEIAHFTPKLASFFADGAFKVKPLASATTIDLDQLSKHGIIEHDVSLSRDDAALQDNAVFSWERWKEVLHVLASGKEEGMVTQKEAVRARYERVVQSKKRHRAVGGHIEYGWKEALFGFGETALWLNLLGDGEKVPLEHLRVFFEEQRMPYTEGWRPQEEEISQGTLSRSMWGLVRAHPHKLAEFWIIVQGTARVFAAKITRCLRWCCGDRAG